MKAGRLYLWVIAAILIGGAIGHFAPQAGVALKPAGDAFIALIKMLIGPVIFLTVVLGIAGASDVKKVGRVGAKSLLYFEVISTFALGIGLLVVNVLKPGSGFNVDPATLDAAAVSGYAKQAQSQGVLDFVLHIIPHSFTDAFAGSGDLLQVLLVAVLFGIALSRLGAAGAPVLTLFESASKVFFGMVGLVMRLAPLGAGGAMAFTIGKYGIGSLGPMLKLMGAFYLTCALFVVLVLGTSSSESALVPLMQKLERLGCSRSVVGLVVPSGYSFNLDGTNIYLTMAAMFVAQALNIQLSLGQELSLLAVAILTSKGASGVTGAGFITLAATLAVVPSVPVAGLALILGIDRFMSEGRALTNVIGNGVAAIVIACWEGELDRDKLNSELRPRPPGGAGSRQGSSESQGRPAAAG